VIEVRVPKWGLTMEDAVVLTWLKERGERVRAGEDLVELETDKVTATVESPADGVLAEIVAEPGETVTVEALLGRVDDGT
jgi:pyruvate/2-oxoglutarate dehydrogenase complex dihydrolipoamide acyltransferase (E2) component